MSTYRINHDERTAAAAYAISVLAAIANGEQPLATRETAAQYAQRHLDALVADGTICVAEDGHP